MIIIINEPVHGLGSNIKILQDTKDKTVDINIVKMFSEESNINLKVIDN